MKKILLGIALVIVLAIAGGAAWLYSSLDSLVASAIRTYAPEILGVPVKLASAKISPVDGSAALRGLVIGNPPGFQTPRALSLDEISMRLDINSLTKDVVLIKEISVIKPDVTYEHKSGGSNLEVIQRNVERYVARHAGGGKGEAKDAKGKASAKKFIIEHVYIRDGKAEASAEILKGKTVSVPIPDLHLTDIGKKSDGATGGETAKQIVGAITSSVTRATSSVISGAVDSVRKGVEAVGDKIKGLLGK